MMPDGTDLAALESRIGYRFSDRSLVERALTHSSAVAGSIGGHDATYERLEFLGDRVLALVVAGMLLEHFPQAAEGDLARRLTSLVRNETCAEIALSLDLGPLMRLSPGELQSGGRTKPTILGDVCEALIGAIYLDGGLEPAGRFVDAHWRDRMISNATPLRDAKTTLQEWAQGRKMPTPDYRIVERQGPEHAPRFVVAVSVRGLDPQRGEGGSRREAEQNAASALLVHQGIWRSEGP